MDLRTVSLESQTPTPSRLTSACRLSNPPEEGELPELSWVRENSPGEGLRSIWTPRRDGAANEPAVLIENCGQPDWKLTLKLWSRYRSISPLEVAKTTNWLIEHEMTPEETARRAAPLMGLPASPEWVEAYRRMTDLPPEIQQKLHAGACSPKLVRFLNQAPEPLPEALWGPIGNGELSLSVQEGRMLAEAARRLSTSQRETCVEWLRELDGDRSPRERGRAFLDHVRSRAYPETTKRRREFERDRDGLDLDGRLRVSPPDRFEGDYLDFRFRCGRDDDFESILEDLRRCQKLFDHV